MTIQQQLTERLHVAMKEKNEFERDFIRFILSTFSRKDKNLEDVDALPILISLKNDLSQKVKTEQSEKECLFLDEYLPKTMKTDEITEYISNMIVEHGIAKEMKNMGLIIKKFKEEKPGQDGKVVSEIVKKLLQ